MNRGSDPSLRLPSRASLPMGLDIRIRMEKHLSTSKKTHFLDSGIGGAAYIRPEPRAADHGLRQILKQPEAAP